MTILINNMQLKNTSLGYFELKLFSLPVDYITLQDFKLPYKTFCLLPFDFIFLFLFSQDMVQTKITWIFFYVYFLSENLVVMMKAWWNLSTSAVKIIVVVYTQEMRGNLFLHCPKLPSPFLIKSTNIWMIMLARIFKYSIKLQEKNVGILCLFNDQRWVIWGHREN